jgi:type II secretory pathway pseudopilin PulG
MTMVELLVSMGILALIMVAFSTILAQTRTVSDMSNAFIQANASASAIAQVLRDDMARLSPQGFLAVYDPNNPATDPNNRLVFTAVGTFTGTTSTTKDSVANAARIAYGLDANGNLWRKATLLLPGAATTTLDVENTWLGQYDPNCPSRIDTVNQMPTYCADPNIPKTVALDTNGFWSLLAGSCAQFRVSWWNPTGNTWVTTTATNLQLWTTTAFEDPNSASPYPLPPAIKVNFRLKTGNDPNKDYMDYEVICPVPR